MHFLRFTHLSRLRTNIHLSTKHPAGRFHTRPSKHRRGAQQDSNPAPDAESDIEVVFEEANKRYEGLKRELMEEDESERDEVGVIESAEKTKKQVRVVPEYRIPHRFIGFDPRRMDLEDFPFFRTDFDGKRSKLRWTGTECQKCGLQIRREKRSNRESSLNVYASPDIPEDLLRSCPERKQYPLLWRTRDPYVVLDILAVEDY